MLTGRQIREARKLFGWNRKDMTAELSIIGASSLRRFEMCDGLPSISDDYAAAIQKALEAAGVISIEASGKVSSMILQQLASVQKTTIIVA